MHKTRNKRKQLFIALGFVAPFFLLYTVFTIWPVVQGVYVSLHKWTLMGKLKFVGLDNYLKFIGDKNFWGALQNTTVFVLITAPLLVITAMVLALLANRPTRIKKGLRICYYLPSVLSVSVAAFIAKYVRTIQGVYQWISSCHRSSGGKPGTPVAAGWKPGLGDDYIHDGMVDSRIQYDALSVSVTGYFAPGV